MKKQLEDKMKQTIILKLLVFILLFSLLTYFSIQTLFKTKESQNQKFARWQENTFEGYYSGKYKFKYPPKLELERPAKLKPKDKTKGDFVINFFPQITGWGYEDPEAWTYQEQQVIINMKKYKELRRYHNDKMYQVEFVPEWTEGISSIIVAWDKSKYNGEEAIRSIYSVLETLEEVK